LTLPTKRRWRVRLFYHSHHGGVMAFNQNQINTAKVVQDNSAHDPSPQIRLVAGPGTGKSFSIGERVSWLIGNGADPSHIFAISFTRTSTTDLNTNIRKYCKSISNIDKIQVSTLHSLALRILARGGQLTQYPASPRVLDDWEQRNIFEEELKQKHHFPIKRCHELITHFEAIWSTGSPPLPFVSSPTPAITVAEESAFRSFHRERSQLYSFILNGEAVRQCVDHMNSGVLNPRSLLNIDHLIVDEYQDLNNCDVEFIDLLARSGTKIFVSGDDDQSIYSFRYAYPVGIQTFTTRYATAGQHALQLCFRCTPAITSASTSLLSQYSPTTRIPKAYSSAYANSTPPVQGSVICLSYPNDTNEARAIAHSIRDLVTAGIPPEDILILLSNRPSQLEQIESEMQIANIELDVSQNIGFADEDTIRFIYAVLRMLKSSTDYLSYRTLEFLQKGIGINTCTTIADKILTANCNFIDQFGPRQSAAIFTSKEKGCLANVVSIRGTISSWQLTDTLVQRSAEILTLLGMYLSQNAPNEWTAWATQLPAQITLADILLLLETRSENNARTVLASIYERMNLPIPSFLQTIGRVRIMSFHSAKGLSAKIVFIPGLEEELLPGQLRARYPAQVEEAARLLYVGITRARASCVLSYSTTRFSNGRRANTHPSRFASSIGVRFQPRATGLTTSEISHIVTDCQNL